MWGCFSNDLQVHTQQETPLVMLQSRGKWRKNMSKRREGHLQSNAYQKKIYMIIIVKYVKYKIGVHHCKELLEMYGMEFWITQFGFRMRELHLPEDGDNELNRRNRQFGRTGLSSAEPKLPPKDPNFGQKLSNTS